MTRNKRRHSKSSSQPLRSSPAGGGRFVVILAGGKGERFWPLSRRRTPKQLLPIVGERPMLAQTVRRVLPMVPRKNILIITNAEQVAAVRRVCPQIPAANIVGEPVGRDSAPAVGLAAALVGQRHAGGVFAILAADHIIHDEAAFRRDLDLAFDGAAAAPVLITIGIKPTEPNTGYGYIKAAGKAWGRAGRSLLKVERFVEKPDAATAQRYVAGGGYYWNAGMFVWSVAAVRDAFARHAPALRAGLARIEEALARGRSLGPALKRVYPGLEKISVDYALMEKADNVLMLPASFDWDDVGSWPAVARHQAADAQGNVARGRAVIVEGKGNIVVSSDGHITALLGTQDLVVVHTPDATLVCPRARAQEIKLLLKELGGDPAAARVL